jgi:hypothetical protein
MPESILVKRTLIADRCQEYCCWFYYVQQTKALEVVGVD